MSHPSQTSPSSIYFFDELGKLERSQLSYRWADEWVRGMKRIRNLAPGTIRKRVGALSEMLAWEIRTSPNLGLPNPLTSLPRGYSTYNEVDAEVARSAGREPRVDVQRERRLAVGEERQILAALAGKKRPDRERPLVSDDLPMLRALFQLIIGTGVRLREAYTTRASQIDLASRRYRVRSTKQWRGRVKFRDAPMTREIHQLLTEHMSSRPFWSANDLIFPFWDGDEATLSDVTNRLSKRFKTLLEYECCVDLAEHDLRHEATCWWFELRSPDGSWMFYQEEISKIMGWVPGSSMAERYVSFRAEDMTARLWANVA